MAAGLSAGWKTETAPASEEKAEQFAEKVKEGERLKGERKRWIKDQLEWKKTREAMQEKIEFLVKRSNTQTQR
eukprot:COSAG01_NODE_9995_length_2280_cov_2.172856_1_plen_72_part_10